MSGYFKSTIYKIGSVLGAIKTKFGQKYYTYAFGEGDGGYKRTKREAFEYAQRNARLYRLEDGEWEKIKSHKQRVNF